MNGLTSGWCEKSQTAAFKGHSGKDPIKKFSKQIQAVDRHKCSKPQAYGHAQRVAEQFSAQNIRFRDAAISVQGEIGHWCQLTKLLELFKVSGNFRMYLGQRVILQPQFNLMNLQFMEEPERVLSRLRQRRNTLPLCEKSFGN